MHVGGLPCIDIGAVARSFGLHAMKSIKFEGANSFLAF